MEAKKLLYAQSMYKEPKRFWSTRNLENYSQFWAQSHMWVVVSMEGLVARGSHSVTNRNGMGLPHPPPPA